MRTGPSGLRGPGGCTRVPFTRRKEPDAALTVGAMLAGTYHGGFNRTEGTALARLGVRVRGAPTTARERRTSAPSWKATTSAAAMLARMKRPRVWSKARPRRRARVPPTAAFSAEPGKGLARAARRMRDARLAGSSVAGAVSALEVLARAAWPAEESVANAARPPANERRVWGMGGCP